MMEQRRFDSAGFRCLGLAGALLLASCQAPPVTPDLHARDAPAKIPGIVHAAGQPDEAHLPELVAALDDEDPAVRLFAIQALVKMTDHDLGYIWFATRDQRQPALTRWRAFRDDQLSGQRSDTP